MRALKWLALALIVLLAACGSPPVRPESTLRVRIGSDITSLDPASIFGIESQTVAGHIFGGLLRYNDTSGALEPDLAERWEVADGGRSYTFHLRRGVRWHGDYGELSADDVIFSIERVRDPATASRYAGEFADVVGLSAPDPATVRVELARPDAGFLNKVAAFAQGMVVSRRAVAALGAEHAARPIGTGPFRFVERVAGEQVTLDANPDYYGGPPGVERLVFRVIREESTAEIALRNGEVDILFALQSPEVIARLRADTGVVVQERPANNTVNLVLNTSLPPLDDVRVRRAIAHAIDRQGLIGGFFRGLKTPAPTPLTPNFAEYTDAVPDYAYDPARARALLAEAGAAGFTLELSSVALYPYDQIVVPIADNLRQAGVDAQIRVLDRAAYNELRAAGDPQAVITAIVGPPDPANVLWKLYHSASFPPGLNTARYRGVDGPLEQARAELDPARRAERYREAQRTAMADLPVIPLYTDRLVQAARPNVRNLTQNALFTLSLAPVSLDP